jgi:uncharacterized protein YoxC
MAVDNIIEELERVEGKKSKVKNQKSKVDAGKSKSSGGKGENGLFSLAIVVVVILGVIGIVFGYTKDKIGELKQGGADTTKGLEEQVVLLKNELLSLKQKTSTLEQENLANKETVLDLFTKSRKLPTKVVSTDWAVLRDPALSFTVSFPKTWESVKAVIQAEKEGQPAPEAVSFQPIGQADFINAITVRTDYTDFANLKMAEKQDIFAEIDALDRRDFAGGKMIYFINLDKENKEVPTILVLTEKAIYRATFNITSRQAANYLTYRENFEEIVSTFTLVPKGAGAPAPSEKR